MTWVVGMSNEEYHATDGVSSSALPSLLDGPAYYKQYQKGFSVTPAMQFGTYVHTCVLEPELWNPETVDPGDSRLKVGGDAYMAKMQEMATRVRVVADSVLQCGKAMALLDGCEKEMSLFIDWEGAPCRTRWDGYDRRRGRGVDLKTTSATTLEGCVRAILDFQYDIKQAFYRVLTGEEEMQGFAVPDYDWIFVSTKAPHPVWIIKPSEAMLDVGIMKSKQAVAVYRECMKRNVWPLPDPGPHVVEYPKYFRR